MSAEKCSPWTKVVESKLTKTNVFITINNKYEQTVFGLMEELEQEHQNICAFVICGCF